MMPVRAALFAVITLAGCPPVSVDLSGRDCSDGECADGYRCRTDRNTCAPVIAIGCNDPTAVCAWTSRAGDPCSPVDAFLPCVDGREDCRGGCRTCLDSGVWSTCSDPDCELGQVWSCDRCDHDCREEVANAEPTCNTSVAPSLCSYTGDCLGAWVDADDVRANGCECLPTGGETCNGRDDDCDGLVDDDATCAGAAVCEDGACVPCSDDDPLHCGAACAVCDAAAVCEDGGCVPCTADDPLHCGATCQVCAGDNPNCVNGGCACTEGSCPTEQFCDAGSCRACPSDDDDHCGSECLQCNDETDRCIDGTCQCTASSCNTGRWCNGGTCQACDVADHCGATCTQCPAATPVCAAGACECAAGSCPPGQYCNAGACTLCACPTLFSACVDQGNTYVCRCSATSCGTGGSCEDSDTACVYADSFDTGGSILEACTGDLNSSWALGEPTAGACRSVPNCWATNLAGDYNDCELSCVISPAADLDGVTGTIDVTFWAWYQLEYSYDGVTPMFADDTAWRVVEPEGGWDIGAVVLGDGCDWTVPWPAFGQYTSSDAVAWTPIRFRIDSATSPEFFHESFAWRIVLESDPATTSVGFFVDDVEVRFTQSP